MGFMDKLNDKLKNASQENDEQQGEGYIPPALGEVEEAVPGMGGPRASAEDILEILQIPATFEIPPGKFLPSDLTEVEFDHQVPFGYDLSQVTRFVGQTRDTVHFYVKLLRLRNEHVAKLATVVDKLQVDANNMRFERDIATGVSIMPTSGDGALEEQLTEALLAQRRLEDQLRQANARLTNETRVDQAGYEALMDELSVANLQLGELRDENQGLRTRIAYMEEEEGLAPTPVMGPSTPAKPDAPAAALPSFDEDDEDELPLVMPPREEHSLPPTSAPSRSLPTPTSLFPRQVDFGTPDDDLAYPATPEPSISGGMIFGEPDAARTEEKNKSPFSLDDDDDLDFIMGDSNQRNV